MRYQCTIVRISSDLATYLVFLNCHRFLQYQLVLMLILLFPFFGRDNGE